MAEKKFDCIERRINDVFQAIEVVRPVVSLIKKQCSLQKERTELFDRIDILEKDNNSLEDLISSISSDEMKEELYNILAKYSNRSLALKDKVEKLNSQIDSIREETAQYREYANSFYYVGTEEIVRDLLRKAVSEECSMEDFFAILLILKGDCVENYEKVETIVYEYAEEVTDDYRKHVLKHIEDYDQDDICNLIAEK